MKIISNLNENDVINWMGVENNKIKLSTHIAWEKYSKLLDDYGWERYYFNFEGRFRGGELVLKSFLKILKKENKLKQFYIELLKL